MIVTIVENEMNDWCTFKLIFYLRFLMKLLSNNFGNLLFALTLFVKPWWVPSTAADDTWKLMIGWQSIFLWWKKKDLKKSLCFSVTGQSTSLLTKIGYKADLVMGGKQSFAESFWTDSAKKHQNFKARTGTG